MIKTVSSSQTEILGSILTLRGLERFDVDLTYGNGSFYRGSIPKPEHRFDIDATLADVVCAESSAVPLADASVRSVVYDPPFLTYVRKGRTGNGSMILSRRFAGYWRYDELEADYRATLREAHRILSHRGTLVVKCQDIVHNHRLHATHANVIDWATGFRLADLFVLTASHRLPFPNRRGTQRHARIHHSYFLVFEKGKT